jgi:hypothetical protein
MKPCLEINLMVEFVLEKLEGKKQKQLLAKSRK